MFTSGIASPVGRGRRSGEEVNSKMDQNKTKKISAPSVPLYRRKNFRPGREGVGSTFPFPTPLIFIFGGERYADGYSFWSFALSTQFFQMYTFIMISLNIPTWMFTLLGTVTGWHSSWETSICSFPTVFFSCVELVWLTSNPAKIHASVRHCFACLQGARYEPVH